MGCILPASVFFPCFVFPPPLSVSISHPRPFFFPFFVSLLCVLCRDRVIPPPEALSLCMTVFLLCDSPAVYAGCGERFSSGQQSVGTVFPSHRDLFFPVYARVCLHVRVVPVAWGVKAQHACPLLLTLVQFCLSNWGQFVLFLAGGYDIVLCQTCVCTSSFPLPLYSYSCCPRSPESNGSYFIQIRWFRLENEPFHVLPHFVVFLECSICGRYVFVRVSCSRHRPESNGPKNVQIGPFRLENAGTPGTLQKYARLKCDPGGPPHSHFFSSSFVS